MPALAFSIVPMEISSYWSAHFYAIFTPSVYVLGYVGRTRELQKCPGEELKHDRSLQECGKAHVRTRAGQLEALSPPRHLPAPTDKTVRKLRRSPSL